MKTILIIVCGVLLYNSPGARNMTADALNGVSNFIDTRPDNSLTESSHFTIPNPFHNND